jgi:hypothetical protein
MPLLKTNQKQPFVFVGPSEDKDTVLALEHLLSQARAGDIVGLVAIPMYRQRHYTAVLTGESDRNPTWAAGCASVVVSMMLKDIRDSLQQERT